MSTILITKEDIQRRILNACKSITATILLNVRNNIIQKINKCLDVNSFHFGHLIK